MLSGRRAASASGAAAGVVRVPPRGVRRAQDEDAGGRTALVRPLSPALRPVTTCPVPGWRCGSRRAVPYVRPWRSCPVQESRGGTQTAPPSEIVPGVGTLGVLRTPSQLGSKHGNLTVVSRDYSVTHALLETHIGGRWDIARVDVPVAGSA